jgi:hypothetical protein
MKTIAQDSRYVAIVTMWPEHVRYWENLMDRKVDCISAPVDLDHYHPNGSKHNFGGKGHKLYNVVCADMWRQDSCPFDVIQAEIGMNNIGHNYKLHIYGIQGKLSDAQKTLFDCLGKNLGEVGWSKDMAPIYRSAQKVITCNNIATRTVREAMACGCSVQKYRLCFGDEKLSPREYAEKHFNPTVSATSLISIAEGALCGR